MRWEWPWTLWALQPCLAGIRLTVFHPTRRRLVTKSPGLELNEFSNAIHKYCCRLLNCDTDNASLSSQSPSRLSSFCSVSTPLTIALPPEKSNATNPSFSPCSGLHSLQRGLVRNRFHSRNLFEQGGTFKEMCDQGGIRAADLSRKTLWDYVLTSAGWF